MPLDSDGDFVNFEDLPAQSLEGAHGSRIVCVYLQG